MENNNINTNNHGQALAALILGIVAAASCFFGIGAVVGLVCGIIGIVMSNKAKAAGNTEGIRKAGFICSVVGTVIAGLAFIIAIAAVGIMGVLISSY